MEYFSLQIPLDLAIWFRQLLAGKCRYIALYIISILIWLFPQFIVLKLLVIALIVMFHYLNDAIMQINDILASSDDE